MPFSGTNSLAHRNKWSNIFVILIFIGVILRILKAYLVPDIDQDEAIIYKVVMSHSVLEILLMKNFDYNGYPPLGILLLKFWSFVSDSELTYRIPSLIASIGSIFIFARISRMIFLKDPVLQFMSLLYFSTSSFFIYYGVIYRGYSFAIFLCLVTGLNFLNIGKDEKSGTAVSTYRYVIFSTLVFCSLLSDYSTVWVFSSIGLWLIFTRQWERISFRYLVIGCVLFIPLAIYFISSNIDETLAEKARSLPPLTSAFNFLRVSAFFYDIRFLMIQNSKFAFLILLILVTGLYGLRLYSKKNRGLSFLLCLSILFPVFMVTLFSIMISPIYDYKHLWFSHFALSLSFLIFINESRVRQAGFFILGLIQLATIPLQLINYRNEERLIRSSVVKEAFEYISAEEKRAQAALVIPNGGGWSATVYAYQNWEDYKTSVVYHEYLNAFDLKGKSIYFFDLSEKPDFGLMKKSAEEAGCSPVELSHRVRAGYFAKCVGFEHE